MMHTERKVWHDGNGRRSNASRRSNGQKQLRDSAGSQQAHQLHEKSNVCKTNGLQTGRHGTRRTTTITEYPQHEIIFRTVVRG